MVCYLRFSSGLIALAKNITLQINREDYITELFSMIITKNYSTRQTFNNQYICYAKQRAGIDYFLSKQFLLFVFAQQPIFC